MNALQKTTWFILSTLFVCILSSAAAWHSAQTRRPQRVVTRLTDVVSAIRFSPDGRVLALARGAGGDGRVELWDTQMGNLLHAIKGFDGPVWSVSFASDGKTLVTSSAGIHSNRIQERPRARDGTRFAELKWWDTQTGELKQRVELPGENWMKVIAMHSPNGQLLATVEYRSPTMSSMFSTLPGGRQDFPFSQAMSGASVVFDADLNLLDARTGEVKLKLKPNLTSYERIFFGRDSDPGLDLLAGLPGQPLAFSPDGQFFAAANAREVKLWNCGTGKEAYKLEISKGRLSAIAFSPDGRTLAAASTAFLVRKNKEIIKSEVRLHEVATGALLQTLPINTEAISNVVFAQNGRQLLIAGMQREQQRRFATLELSDIQNGSQGSLLANDEGTESSVTLSPNGETAAFQTDASTVNLVDTQTWKIKHTFNETSDAGSASASVRRFMLSVKSVLALAFSSDGKTVSGEVEQSGIKVWDTQTGEVRKEVTDHEDTNSIVGISSNGTMAAEVGEENLRLWNVGSGKKKTVPVPGGSISAIALSADGQIVALAQLNQIILLNAGTGEFVQALKGQPAQQSKINCMTFSADGRALATAEDSKVEIWDLTIGQIKKTISSAGNVTALRFAPDGRTLASASQDGSVSLWDLQTGALGLHLKKHSAAVNAIAFSKAGDLMATGGDDRSVIIWDTATGKARRTLKGHDLTVTSLAFSPDTSLLASGSGNTSVVLWDVKNGTLNRVLR